MTEKTPRCYLTLHCTDRCWFCSNTLDATREWPRADEMDADGWLALFAGIDSPDVALTGGEPTLHKDFWRIVSEAGKYVHVYSNFHREFKDVPEGLNIHWRASCHEPTVEAAREWVQRVSVMHVLGYKITATVVGGAGYCPADVMDVLRCHGIHVDDPQVCPTPIPGRARCTIPRILIAPDGQRYHCVSKLVRRDATGIMPLAWPNTTIDCTDATRCLACDSVASERTALR